MDILPQVIAWAMLLTGLAIVLAAFIMYLVAATKSSFVLARARRTEETCGYEFLVIEMPITQFYFSKQDTGRGYTASYKAPVAMLTSVYYMFLVGVLALFVAAVIGLWRWKPAPYTPGADSYKKWYSHPLRKGLLNALLPELGLLGMLSMVGVAGAKTAPIVKMQDGSPALARKLFLPVILVPAGLLIMQKLLFPDKPLPFDNGGGLWAIVAAYAGVLVLGLMVAERILQTVVSMRAAVEPPAAVSAIQALNKTLGAMIDYEKGLDPGSRLYTAEFLANYRRVHPGSVAPPPLDGTVPYELYIMNANGSEYQNVLVLGDGTQAKAVAGIRDQLVAYRQADSDFQAALGREEAHLKRFATALFAIAGFALFHNAYARAPGHAVLVLGGITMLAMVAAAMYGWVFSAFALGKI